MKTTVGKSGGVVSIVIEGDPEQDSPEDVAHAFNTVEEIINEEDKS